MGDDVDGVDMEDALDAVQIALMHGIDADVAGEPLRRGRFAYDDGDRRWLGLFPDEAVLAIAGAGAQVIGKL